MTLRQDLADHVVAIAAIARCQHLPHPERQNFARARLAELQDEARLHHADGLADYLANLFDALMQDRPAADPEGPQ